MNINHISLDFWNTIASPNPEFAAARNFFLSKVCDIDEQIVAKLYTTTKKELDELILHQAVHITPYFCYQQLWYNVPFANKSADLFRSIEHKINDLFKYYPPIISDELITALLRLRENNIKLSIASNTNFISGQLLYAELHKALKRNKYNKKISHINELFSFAYFSDLIGTSKPNRLFFELIKINIDNTQSAIHIGDSLIYDAPITNYGIKFQHVKNPQQTLNILNTICI